MGFLLKMVTVNVKWCKVVSDAILWWIKTLLSVSLCVAPAITRTRGWMTCHWWTHKHSHKHTNTCTHWQTKTYKCTHTHFQVKSEDAATAALTVSLVLCHHQIFCGYIWPIVLSCVCMFMNVHVCVCVFCVSTAVALLMRVNVLSWMLTKL